MAAWKSERFAIMMPWGRVGSNLVVSVLSEQARVKIMNEPTTALRSRAENTLTRNFDIDQAQTDYLRNYSPLAGKAGLKLSHRSFISPMMAYHILRTREFRIVAMNRKNHLKSAISQIRADQLRSRKSGSAFAVLASGDRPAPTRIPVSMLMARMESFREQSALMEQYLAQFFGDDQLTVTYEDLARDPVSSIRQISDYLDISLPEKFTLPFAKATSENLADDVVNYDEITAALAGTAFAGFLTD
tara:strand:- start:3595 stop:4329 length:735 start_codon:yes stop_codon:yes gene_type:complete